MKPQNKFNPKEFSLTKKQHRTRKPFKWDRLSDDKLMQLRFKELKIGIEGSGIEPYLEQLHEELKSHGILFRPHYWFSYEWFVADGVPGIAIPFYLAHPRLAALEQTQMLQIEGGTPEDFMKILRHEAGHALENAYRLRSRRDLQKMFGPSTTVKYPSYYIPKPYSRSYVRHIEPFYAQSHPDEDFAETFAVWLTPGSDWRVRYRGWPAFEKLDFMDRLMNSLAGKKPLIHNKELVDPVSKIRGTLTKHYQKRRAHFGLDYVPNYDQDLRRLFDSVEVKAESSTALEASRFIQEIRKETRRRVAGWTGEYIYVIDRVIREMSDRCAALKLFVRAPSADAKLDFMGLVAVQTIHAIHRGRHRVAL